MEQSTYFPLEIFFWDILCKTWHLMQFVFYTTNNMQNNSLFCLQSMTLYRLILCPIYLDILPIKYLVLTLCQKKWISCWNMLGSRTILPQCACGLLFIKEYYEWALIIIISHLANYVLVPMYVYEPAVCYVQYKVHIFILSL